MVNRLRVPRAFPNAVHAGSVAFCEYQAAYDQETQSAVADVVQKLSHFGTQNGQFPIIVNSIPCEAAREGVFGTRTGLDDVEAQAV